ncbi:hypothetical protein [Streptomyces sp. NPDC086989]|uniref:hypothetical protein n=1 Tax=Streptomyces sp. NPDC086989 TaxID=3365764 RepID=UPI0037F65E0D
MIMLRRVRDCSARTQASIAKDGHIVATTLSNHLNGGRIPEEPQIRAFFGTVQQEVALVGNEAVKLPCSLDELLDLRRLARKQHCDCVPHTGGDKPAPPDVADESPALPVPSPGSEEDHLLPAAGRRRAGPRPLPPSSPSRRLHPRSRALSRASVLAALARRKVPVPPEEGDRQHRDLPPAQWSELETLTGFILSGRKRDAGLLLWRAGMTLSAPELIGAVSSCRSAGLHEAAESVLSGVTERTDRQAVLNITAAFLHAGRLEDAGFLLAAAAH